MKHLIFTSLCLTLFLLNGFSYCQELPVAWINEFHYDNVGADINEFVEIVVNESFLDLSNFTVSLYNGSNGLVYAAKTLDYFVEGSTQDGFTIFSYDFTFNGGSIQNGPDGIAIDYNGILIPGQFISYEGSFVGIDNPANGITSLDIGIFEHGSDLNSSLGLTGSGTQYSDFSWIVFNGTASPGSPNVNQTLPVELRSFCAKIIDEGVKLSWRTETEAQNYGFEIERASSNPKFEIRNPEFEKKGFIAGNGNSNSPKNYSFIDKSVFPGNYLYRLRQIDTDGKFEYSKSIKVSIEIPVKFELSQNYPNPFNPVTTINYSIPVKSLIRLEVFNTLGETVDVLFEGQRNKGFYIQTWNAEKFPSGIYFLRFIALNNENNKSVNRTIKMLFLK